MGLGKRLGDFGPEHAKKVVALRAGTVQKGEPFGLQVLGCFPAADPLSESESESQIKCGGTPCSNKAVHNAGQCTRSNALDKSKLMFHPGKPVVSVLSHKILADKRCSSGRRPARKLCCFSRCSASSTCSNMKEEGQKKTMEDHVTKKQGSKQLKNVTQSDPQTYPRGGVKLTKKFLTALAAHQQMFQNIRVLNL